MSVAASSTEWRKFSKNLLQLVKATRAKCVQEVGRAARASQTQARSIIKSGPRAAYASGALHTSIGITYSADKLHATVEPAAYYGQWVEGIWHNYEQGRAPGRMPPVGAIGDWCRSKGMGEGLKPSQWLGLLYVIRRKIAREGTPAKPFMRPTREEQYPKFQAAMQDVFKKAAAQSGVLVRSGAV
jgi:hypothetical protein